MKASALDTRPEATAPRADYYRRLDRKSAPALGSAGRYCDPEARSACVAALWRYEEMRRLLMEPVR